MAIQSDRTAKKIAARTVKGTVGDFLLVEIPVLKMAASTLWEFGSAVGRSPAVRIFAGTCEAAQSRVLEVQRALQPIEEAIDRSSLIRDLRVVEANITPFLDSIVSVQRNLELEARRRDSLLSGFSKFMEEESRLREMVRSAMATAASVPKLPEFRSDIGYLHTSGVLDSLIGESSSPFLARPDSLDPDALPVYGEAVLDYIGPGCSSGATDLTCHVCQCSFSVEGPAFFCPRCGVGYTDQILDRAMRDIRDDLDAVPHIRSAVRSSHRSESVALALIEASVNRAVAWFQVIAERLYRRFRTGRVLRRNVFQNLDDGSSYWYGVTGKHYSDYVGSVEMQRIRRNFQNRHLFLHTMGKMDDAYIRRCGETGSMIGKRLVLSREEVSDFLQALEKLVNAMAEDAPCETRPDTL